ncbi:hypothetical protein Paride_0307 [Pseudomonas phage Paride]|nr:hypothetical protein Paride_0307 [Pseudomonas phage Paride]
MKPNAPKRSLKRTQRSLAQRRKASNCPTAPKGGAIAPPFFMTTQSVYYYVFNYIFYIS